ncbi:MAG: hypothetical protein RBR54_09725 [Sulfurimonas sp.]|jgi:hypothetical protein|nr:hypothetical protein [Sulfurimonas sp.]
MFSRILGKKESKDPCDDGLQEKISKMNLTEMRAYVNNKAEVSEQGLIEILKRLTTKDSETSKRYIELDDMDVKIKKAFDLIITIAQHKKITVVAIELIVEFIHFYEDVIEKFDEENKQIYKSKLKEALDVALKNMDGISKLKKKLGLLNFG